MLILGSPFAFTPATLLETITALGLTSGLQLCLDAGDSASYTSGQTWADTSGNGYNFYLGTGSGGDGADPSFNGTAGQRTSSEYFSFDGGDYFTPIAATPTWVNNIHKNNARVTFAAWVYIGTVGGGSPNRLSGNFPSGSGPFYSWYITGVTGDLGFGVGNNTSNAFESSSTLPVSAGVWKFLATSVDEAGNQLILQVDATQQTESCTYSSPSSSDAPAVLHIGASGVGGLNPLSSGSRMAGFCAWSTALSSADMLNIYNATRGKFGL